MYAVIRAGGRQYKVASGDVIEVDRLDAAEGADVAFDAVLVVDGTSVKANAPTSAEREGHREGRRTQARQEDPRLQLPPQDRLEEDARTPPAS